MYKSFYHYAFFLFCICDASCLSVDSTIKKICSKGNFNNIVNFFQKIPLQKNFSYNCETDALNFLNYNAFVNKYSKNITATVKIKVPCESVNTNICFIGGAKCNNFYDYKKGNKLFAKIIPIVGVGIEKAFGKKIKATVDANCNFHQNASAQYMSHKKHRTILNKKIALTGKITFSYHPNFHF